jgi:NAD(P)H-dependent flavin oxidoreductase YrpB (nitropropane dioxygenase family)
VGKHAEVHSHRESRGTWPRSMSRRELLAELQRAGIALAGAVALGGDHMKAAEKKSRSLRTRLTDEFGVRYPFVCAGMAFVGTPALAAAVANAGGIGMLGTGPEQPPGVLNLIRATQALTDRTFGVNFIVDQTAFGPMTTDAHIAACVEAGVKLVTFHWNPPLSQWVDSLHQAGAKVWFQSGLVDQALEAIYAGVDGIIAQSTEAGGHVKATTRTVETLEKMRGAIPSPMLVLAAGGIADGRSAAEALAHGADGVWVGTRLVASLEANAHDEYKRRIVTAPGCATAHTTMFGPEWPDQRIQVLRNRVVKEWGRREDQIPNPPPPPALIGHTTLMPNSVPGGIPYDMPKFSAILPTPETSGDFEEMCMPAGEGVRVIKKVQPAAEIVVGMMEDARAALDEQFAARSL